MSEMNVFAINHTFKPLSFEKTLRLYPGSQTRLIRAASLSRFAYRKKRFFTHVLLRTRPDT